MRGYRSWGRYPVIPQKAATLYWREQLLDGLLAPAERYLPFGNGRSYGDACLSDSGTLVDCRGLDRFIAFDRHTGVVTCEAGVTLDALIDVVLPHGWFPAVVPGTRFVTIGGAIANDVHGKNHHRAGTFAEHLDSFELLRSDGSRITCSAATNADWFAATVGGLGMTGVITHATLRLRRVQGPWIDREIIEVPDLERFFELSAESDRDFDYTVAWVDCLARDADAGRGLFIRGNHSTRPPTSAPMPKATLGVPFDPPFSLVNPLSLKAFNALYYRRGRNARPACVGYQSFFFPLDAISDWNRIYGRRGFLQYQCVVPPEPAADAMAELLGEIAAAGTGSFLAVLKTFGDRPPRGLMSFPRAGATLALDFPNSGERLYRLLDRLDAVVAAAGGAVYPAKDARMSSQMFSASFPRWHEMTPYIDPRIGSAFWNRVAGP